MQGKTPKKQTIPALAEKMDEANIAIVQSSNKEDVFYAQPDRTQPLTPSTGPHEHQYNRYYALVPKTMTNIDPPDLFF
jgi:hypothetical protein